MDNRISATIAKIPERRLAPADDPANVVALGPGGGAALRTGDHGALIYWERDELLRTIVPYLAEGLKAGDKVVYVADDLTTGIVEAALGGAGVNVPAEKEKGSLVVVSSKDAFFGADGSFDVERALAGVRSAAEDAQKAGYRRVRFSVEMTYLLAEAPGIDRGIEFESRANDEVFAKYPFVCVCSFNAARDVNDLVGDVLRTHPVLVRDGLPIENPYYRPWHELRSLGVPSRRANANGAARDADTPGSPTPDDDSSALTG